MNMNDKQTNYTLRNEESLQVLTCPVKELLPSNSHKEFEEFKDNLKGLKPWLKNQVRLLRVPIEPLEVIVENV